MPTHTQKNIPDVRGTRICLWKSSVSAEHFAVCPHIEHEFCRDVKFHTEVNSRGTVSNRAVQTAIGCFVAYVRLR